MKILFVQARNRRNLGTLDKLTIQLSGTPYLSIQQLAAATPSEHSIEFIDERHKKIDFNGDYDLVAIMQCFTQYAFRTYEIADEFRARGIPVVLGGYHPTVLPEEAKQHADSVVIGEQEGIWPSVLKDVENNKLKPFYKSNNFLKPEDIPPHKEEIGGNPFPSARVEALRGCPYNCSFCIIHIMQGTNIRLRPIENIVEEIRSMKQKFFFFTEPSLTLAPEHTKKLFQEIKGLNKKFTCYGHTDVLNKDEELLKLSVDAGCIAWWIDFESISQKTIDSLNKNTNKIKDYASVVKKIHDHGAAAIGTFIFGLDTDTLDVFDKTNEALKKWEVDAIEVNILCPFPGTPLFNKFEKENRILTRDWSKYDEWNIVFKPKNMTPEELWEKSRWLAKEYYSFPNFLRKIIGSIKLGFSPFKYVTPQILLEKRFYSKTF